MPVPASRLITDLESSTGAAFFFLVWEILITLDDEVDLIWSKPRRSWIKWAFLLARYGALSLLFAGRVIELIVTYSTMHLHTNSLRIWFALQGLLAFSIMAGAEIVMIARVHALYNQNKWVKYGFIALMLAEVFAAFLGIGLTFPSPSFNPSMIITTTPGSFEYFSISTLVSQTVLVVMSVARYRYMYKRGHWEGMRIIKLMLRDGTLAFVVFFLLSLLMALYHILQEPFAPSEYVWSISIISVTECRLILNLQKFPIAEPDISTELPEFTTVVTNDHSRPGTSYMMTIYQETQENHELHETHEPQSEIA
ncbi:hypothetical protein C8R41DRAFT_819157 [Lentinula lateritia]|uniref:DUF6533 domain-containing protein n=1 Tax=Lentinula lateritia TaxID=40482 RepID=A0ABQ8VU13_9AGAR|nr:hypothetical protein C8R41DRAFT_819157 [Lentinula lateritia]